MLFEYFTSNEINTNLDLSLKVSIEDLVIEQIKKGVIDENEIYRQSTMFTDAS